jgi:RimJ/RimL family protein N-acetyltransferase
VVRPPDWPLPYFRVKFVVPLFFSHAETNEPVSLVMLDGDYRWPIRPNFDDFPDHFCLMSSEPAVIPLPANGIGCQLDRSPSTGGNLSTPLPTPTLHTTRLRLRPFEEEDADDLFALNSNAFVLRYWDSPPWTEPARAQRFIPSCREMAEEGTGARLAVDRISDGAFIGWCTFNSWNPDFRSASVGYCYGEAAWGQGYATEAARALLQWAFDTLDLNRVQAETDTRNIGSARVLEKLGFLREGTLREDCTVNGDVSDSWIYGLLRRDWQPSAEPGSTR